MAEDKKQSAFDRFSAIGAIQQQGRNRSGKGLDFDAFKQGFEIAQLTKQNIDADIDKNKTKTDALLAEFPGGISVPKMDENLDGVVGDYLKNQRSVYGDLAAIVAEGPEAEGYDSAVGKMNQIEANIKNVNSNLELLANKRASLLDARKNGIEYANSTSMYQNKNLFNLTSGDFESLNPQITVDDNGNATMTILDARGNQVNIDEIDLPNEYSDVLEKGIDGLIDAAQVLKQDGKIKGEWEGSIERRNSIRTIKDLSKNQKLIKDYMFQNPELIDQYIASDLGVDINDVANDPDYEDMIEMYKTMPFDKDKFVDLVTQAVDNKYNTSTTFEKEEKGNFEKNQEEEEGNNTNQFNNPDEVKTTTTEITAGPIASQLLDISRINKPKLVKALKDGVLTDELLKQYLVELPIDTEGNMLSIDENNLIKGFGNIKAADFNALMRKIQREQNINLGYK